MDDPPDRSTHPNRKVPRENFEQPQLPGMEAVGGHRDFVDQQRPGREGPWRSTNIPKRDVIRDWRNREKPAEQLQMFSSARELMQRYRPLEGDRQEVGEEDSWGEGSDPRSSNQTWRQKNSQWYNNYPNKQWAGWHGSGEMPQGSDRETDAEGNRQYTRSDAGRMETDEELWSRKADEAFDPYGRQGAEYESEYGRAGRGTVEPHTTMRAFDSKGNTLETSEQQVTDQTFDHDAGEWKTAQRPMYRHPGREGEHKFGGYDSLGESLQHGGYDWSRHPEGEGGRYKFPISVQFEHEGGDAGPEIVGGHHRLAAMNQIDPDRPIPIEYYKSIWDAKSSGHYT